MSPSPLSFSVDPATPSTRRRNVVPVQKKSGFDFAGGDIIAASPFTGDGDYGKEKDRGRSIRTGPVVDAAKTKGLSPTGRRTTSKRTGASSSTKPLWKTILSVFTNNFVLLLILVVFVQMCRRLMLNQFDGNDAAVCNDYERRTAEAVAFLKTTTKMIQVRIDTVDQKIRKEIGALKNELSNRVDDYVAKFSGRLLELDTRVVNMEKSMTTNTNWLSRDEFYRLMEEFKVHAGFDNHGDLKLDEIRAFAKEIVQKEIEKHAADGLAMVDYAAASGGAKVVKHSDPISWGGWYNRNRVSSGAVKMLQPSFGEPGQCFPLKGNNGFVQIELRTTILPVAITLEHVAKSVAFDPSSAPKDCRVFGWLRNKGTMQMHLLAEFVYDLEKSSIQTFKALDSSIIIDTIRLEFMSNHGNPTHTCIYRIRAHGHEPDTLM